MTKDDIIIAKSFLTEIISANYDAVMIWENQNNDWNDVGDMDELIEEYYALEEAPLEEQKSKLIDVLIAVRRMYHSTNLSKLDFIQQIFAKTCHLHHGEIDLEDGFTMKLRYPFYLQQEHLRNICESIITGKHLRQVIDAFPMEALINYGI